MNDSNDFHKALEINPNNNWMMDLQDNHSGNIIHLEGEGKKHAFSLGHLWVYGTQKAFTEFCKLTDFHTIIVLHNNEILCNGETLEFLLEICEGEGLSEKSCDVVFDAFESDPTYLSVEGFEFIAVN